MLALSKELNDTDAEYFNFRLHDLDWKEYWTNYFIALRTHYFKVQRNGFSETLIYQLEVYEIIQFRIQYKPETVEASKRRLGRMKLAFKVVKGAIAFAVLAFVINLIR